jgi:membrane protein YqaA with SNARE-associated domain
MQWIDWGYFGLFVASFLAATVIPLSSEALFGVMLFHFDPWICLIVATAGNSLGGWLNYGLGYLGNPEWLARIRVKPAQIHRWKDKVNSYGVWLALFSWLPFVGDIMAVALGFFRADWKGSFLFIFVGKFLRYLLILVFYLYVQ